MRFKPKFTPIALLDLPAVVAKSLDEWVERTRGKVSPNCVSAKLLHGSTHLKNITRSQAQQQWKKYFALARTFCYQNERR